MPQTPQSVPKIKINRDFFLQNGYTEDEIKYLQEGIDNGLPIDKLSEQIKITAPLNVTPAPLSFGIGGERGKQIIEKTDISRDPVIDFTRPILSNAAQGLVGSRFGPTAGRAAYAATDIGMQNLYKNPTQGVASQILQSQDPRSWLSQILNTVEQKSFDKAMGGLQRRSFAVDFPQMELMKSGSTAGLVPQRVPQQLDYLKPTTSQRADFAATQATNPISKGNLSLLQRVSEFLENRAAPGTKNRALSRTAGLAKQQAREIANELTEQGIKFTEAEWENPALMISRLSKEIPAKDITDVKARMSPLQFEPVTRTVTRSTPIIQNRVTKQTVTPSAPISQNWVDTRIVPGPSKTQVFESPKIQPKQNPETGHFQPRYDPEDPSNLISRQIPGKAQEQVLGRGREVTGAKIGPPRTIVLGDEDVVTGARISKPSTEVIGERLVPGGPGGSVKKVTSGATREVPYLTSIDKADKLIRDEHELEKMLTHAQQATGNENTRKNVGAYHFMRMVQRSSEKNPKTGEMMINPDLFSKEINLPENQGHIGKLYNARQKSDIQQFAKNLAFTQGKPPTNTPYRISAGGLTLTGLLSSALWKDPTAAIAGTSISIGANLIGRALVNDKYVGRTLVRMAGGEPLGMPVQTAMRQILNAMNGGIVGAINTQTGKEQRARIENGKLVPIE